MIEVQNITKQYGATVAVNNVSFKAEAGQIVGFLGPNGAGKSTTLKILTCYIVADSGRVSVAGYDVLEQSLEVRKNVGYLPENTPLYVDMRVHSFLEFVARARQIPPKLRRSRIDEVVALTGIKPMLKKAIGHLSRGYRQRVGLAQALIHDPPILILDEPTSGLDPHQIIEIRQLIKRLGESKLILFSTHILQEISAICTRVMVIKDGSLVANATLDDLVQKTTGGMIYRIRIQAPREEFQERLRSLEGITEANHLRDEDSFGVFRVRTANGQDLGPEIFKLAKESGWTIARLEEEERTLEDMYLQLTAE